LNLTQRPLVAILDEARQGNVPPDATSRLLAPAETVGLPPMPIGSQMLIHGRTQEATDGAAWTDRSYTSQQIWECTYRDARIHGPEGIVRLGDTVVAETLLHAPPGCFESSGDAIRLPETPPAPLEGTWLSLLVGGHANYYHWMIEGLGRLALADPDMLANVSQVLVPGPATGFRTASLALSGVLRGRTLREVHPGDCLRLPRVVVPWATSHAPAPHPRLRRFFARLRDAAGPFPARRWPTRLYLDRRGTGNRPLVNEEALIQGLSARGFTVIRLEDHPLADQIGLFAHAEIIVAPHGAGLTNLVFARPQTLVLELHMDGYLNWCFRRLAAACGVRYDCVIGRQIDSHPWVQARRWEISVQHALAAVDHHL
jgi:capsular polysaccharide biosynthesis protein